MAKPIKGRGALSRPPGRFDRQVTEAIDDGWSAASSLEDETPASIATSCDAERAKTIITRNNSPDIPFDQSINPYRGCEHGCIYCYARPSHAFVGLSPGLDFETKLFYKQDAARLLESELAKPGYVCKTIMLGSNTDPYQPVERRLLVTRSILQVMQRYKHPVSVITKGALIERDIELLADLAQHNLTNVMISLPTLDVGLKRTLEPRAASPAARLRVMRQLADAGVPVGVMVAPVIPVVTDDEIEKVLEAAAAAGALSASYVMLRLPFEVKDLFREWLAEHFSERAAHVMARVNDLRGGRDNDPAFKTRMSGQGVFAELIRKRFELACRRLGLRQNRAAALDTRQFCPPQVAGAQLAMAF